MEWDSTEEFVAWAVDSLPPGVVSDEETKEIIEEFFRVVAETRSPLDDKLDDILDVLSAADCPAAALDGLMSMVGFTPGMGWTQSLTDAEKRKFLTLAAYLWRIKGEPDATRALCRVLTKRDCVIWDWPFFRYVAGGDIPFIVWPGPAGDLYSDIHLSDPHTDADRTLTALALPTIKPGTDTWTLVWCLLAEPFLQGLYQWAVTGTPTCEVGDGQVVIDDGEGIETDFGVETTSWTVGRLLTSFKWDATGYVDFRLAIIESDRYYRVRVTTTQVQIDLIQGGAVVPIASGAFVSGADVWYWLDARLIETVTGYQLDVRVDGNLICSGTV